MPEYSDYAQILIKLLERAARAYTRTTILYETDNRLHLLFDSEHWPELRQLLLEHEIVSVEERESQGANVLAYRLRVNADELLAGQTDDGGPPSTTAGLWQALRAL